MAAELTKDPDSLILRLREIQSAIATHATSVAAKIARRTQKKYPWICADDVQQDLLLRLDKWMREFEPHHGSHTTWSKYLYHKMSFYAKDLLRKEDPLGIGWPQRRNYPTWFRLGEQSVRMTAATAPRSQAGHAADPQCTVGADLHPGQFRQASGRYDTTDDAVAESDAQFVADYLAVHKLFQSLPKPPRQIPVVINGDTLRHSRCLWWDARKNRVRFRRRRSDTLAHWMAARRSPQPTRPRTSRRTMQTSRQLTLCLDQME